MPSFPALGFRLCALCDNRPLHPTHVRGHTLTYSHPYRLTTAYSAGEGEDAVVLGGAHEIQDIVMNRVEVLVHPLHSRLYPCRLRSQQQHTRTRPVSVILVRVQTNHGLCNLLLRWYLGCLLAARPVPLEQHNTHADRQNDGLGQHIRAQIHRLGLPTIPPTPS